MWNCVCECVNVWVSDMWWEPVKEKHGYEECFVKKGPNIACDKCSALRMLYWENDGQVIHVGDKQCTLLQYA